MDPQIQADPWIAQQIAPNILTDWQPPLNLYNSVGVGVVWKTASRHLAALKLLLLDTCVSYQADTDCCTCPTHKSSRLRKDPWILRRSTDCCADPCDCADPQIHIDRLATSTKPLQSTEQNNRLSASE